MNECEHCFLIDGPYDIEVYGFEDFYTSYHIKFCYNCGKDLVEKKELNEAMKHTERFIRDNLDALDQLSRSVVSG